MKPNYICIGVQKGSTTSLINYLNLHPEIYMATGEKHFFDRRLSYGKLSDKDINRYEKSFKTNKTIVGEKTPSYCYLRYAIDRIYNYDKNMKLIIILREPISRAFSQYNMELSFKKTLDDKSEEQIFNEFKSGENLQLNELKSNGSYFIIRGFYDEILEYILSKFSRNNLYIGISEEINQNKQKYYNEIYEFLGTTKLIKIDNTLNTRVGNYKKSIPEKLEEYLYNIYKPHNEKLYKILGRRIDSGKLLYSIKVGILNVKLIVYFYIKDNYHYMISIYYNIQHIVLFFYKFYILFHIL